MVSQYCSPDAVCIFSAASDILRGHIIAQGVEAGDNSGKSGIEKVHSVAEVSIVRDPPIVETQSADGRNLRIDFGHWNTCKYRGLKTLQQ